MDYAGLKKAFGLWQEKEIIKVMEKGQQLRDKMLVIWVGLNQTQNYLAFAHAVQASEDSVSKSWP